MAEILEKNGHEDEVTGSAQGDADGVLFPEFEELQRDIARRIRDNNRFLERVFDEDFSEDEGDGAADEDEEIFEEL